MMRATIAILFFFCVIISSAQEQSPLKLWYNAPAKDWITESFTGGLCNAHIPNGKVPWFHTIQGKTYKLL